MHCKILSQSLTSARRIGWRRSVQCSCWVELEVWLYSNITNGKRVQAVPPVVLAAVQLKVRPWETAKPFGIRARWIVVFEWDNWGGTATYVRYGAKEDTKGHWWGLSLVRHHCKTLGEYQIRDQSTEERLVQGVYCDCSLPNCCTTCLVFRWQNDISKSTICYCGICLIFNRTIIPGILFSNPGPKPETGENGNLHLSLERNNRINDPLVCLYWASPKHSSSQLGLLLCPQACNAAQVWIQVCSPASDSHWCDMCRTWQTECTRRWAQIKTLSHWANQEQLQFLTAPQEQGSGKSTSIMASTNRSASILHNGPYMGRCVYIDAKVEHRFQVSPLEKPLACVLLHDLGQADFENHNLSNNQDSASKVSQSAAQTQSSLWKASIVEGRQSVLWTTIKRITMQTHVQVTKDLEEMRSQTVELQEGELTEQGGGGFLDVVVISPRDLNQPWKVEICIAAMYQ